MTASPAGPGRVGRRVDVGDDDLDRLTTVGQSVDFVLARL